MNLKSRFKELFHRHKHNTLLIYPPRHDQYYSFLLRCDCGHAKLTTLDYKITEVLFVVDPNNLGKEKNDGTDQCSSTN